MSCHDPGPDWYLAQYKPNSHQMAERNLVRQGFRTFLPLQEVTRPERGKLVTRARPLFPGYLFVALNRREGGWRQINATHGITRLVCLGAEPTPVPPDLVSQLMLRCDREGRLRSPPVLHPGESVRMLTGPFAGLVAAIEAIAPDRRVWVLLEVMGTRTRVAMAATRLHPLRP